MNKYKKPNDSIFDRDNDFAMVMASICIARKLSNDPLSNQIIVQAIERANSLSQPVFAETVLSLAEEEGTYNQNEQGEEEVGAYVQDDELDEKLFEDEDEVVNDKDAEDEDSDSEYETEEEELLDLEDDAE